MFLSRKRSMAAARSILRIGDLDDLVEMQRSVTCSVDVTHLRGTTQYMSPEMVKKFAGVSNEIPGRKTDIWSLGCIMLELANCAMKLQDLWIQKNGKVVEPGNMLNTRFFTMVIDGGVPFIDSSLSVDLASCIQDCLRPKSEKRISANELVSYLSATRFHGGVRRLEQALNVDTLSAKHVAFFHFTADPDRSWHVRCNVPLVHRDLVSMQCYNVWTSTLSKTLLPSHIHGNFLYPYVAIGKQGVICQTTDSHLEGGSVNTFVWNTAKQTSRTLYISDSSSLFYHPITVENMLYFWDQRAVDMDFKRVNILNGRVESIAGPEDKRQMDSIVCGALLDHRIIYIAASVAWPTRDSTQFHCYDTSTGEWKCLYGLPNDRIGCELIALQGKIYMLGGVAAGTRQRILKTCYRV
ncbi:uncharacterized protein LOC129595886 [Paramacrobiotus metropolitanus]|uniref:uncharacterized protein LOC129595886 n=1 Tax=Paramacrobiotus metropolitanus TaxID=2943436 RepID=UPI0024458D6F|nr:uncharacterized protein LOC129595886 [Paramacrobiotus metropolitanus]XP_055348994.1 uncharacterized protein LOC129595886 [Paramacrobiotus metropolitanus]